MELVKTNESEDREFSENQTLKKITSVTYQIKENDKIVGNATVRQSGYTLDINKPGVSAEQLMVELETLFTNKTV